MLDFENGIPAGVTVVDPNGTDVSVTTDPKFLHSGSKALLIHYKIGADEAEHQDRNRAIELWAADQTAFNLRGFVKLGTPVNSQKVARKLFYLFSSDGTFQLIIGLFGTDPFPQTELVPGIQIAGIPTQSLWWGIGANQFDCFWGIEVAVRLNTPGVADGSIEIWLRNEATGEEQHQAQTGVMFRNTSAGYNKFNIGDQVDRFGFFDVDELRAWDDIQLWTADQLKAAGKTRVGW